MENRRRGSYRATAGRPIRPFFIVLSMDTSLAYILGFREVTRVARIIAEREFRAFEVFTFIAVVYFICTYAMSLVARHFERRLHTG